MNGGIEVETYECGRNQTLVFKDSNGASAASTKKILGIEPPYTVGCVEGRFSSTPRRGWDG